MGAVSRRTPMYPQQDAGQTRRHRPDYWLVLLTALLLAIGLVVVYSISPALAVGKDVDGGHIVARQLIAIGLGIGMFIVTAHVPLSAWRKWYVPLLALAAVATFITLITPVNAQYPAHRWIRVGGLSFQSVELLKFALLIALAGFLTVRMQKDEMASWHRTLKPLVWVLGGVGLVVAFLQSDLGSMGVITAMMGIMAFVAGLPMRRIILIGAAIILLLVTSVIVAPYRRERLATYLNPESNCLTAGGYQACQALIAIGSGGMAGLGLGRSVQAYGYLPEAENDSIFAIYAEKFGFLGTTVLLALFVALFTRMKQVAERAPDSFSRLLVVGILTWFAVQSMINIGAMIGLLPLKGITLPLISYGGSSVIMVLAALGLVFQVSRYTLHRVPETMNVNRGGRAYDDSRDRRRFRGAYHPAPGRRA